MKSRDKKLSIFLVEEANINISSYMFNLCKFDLALCIDTPNYSQL